jgi:hypothetical protein
MLTLLKWKCLPFLFLLSFVIFPISANITDTTYYEIWDINSLDSTGGHDITVIGNPEIVDTELGDAVKFDGDGDMLLVDANPVGDAKEFTVEVIFKPDAAYSISNDPRFIHIQDPDDPMEKRIMMELRINPLNEWYLDGFMKTDIDDLALIKESLTHPTEEWMHAAITYKGNVFKTYVNGIEELSDTVKYNTDIINPTGKTSVGARMNEIKWYSGLIKTLKVSHKALEPSEFIVNQISQVFDHFNLNKEGITVFPYPADQFVNIAIGLTKKSEGQIYVYNVKGEKVNADESFFYKGINLLRMNTEHLTEGIYYVVVNIDNYTLAKSLIIDR